MSPVASAFVALALAVVSYGVGTVLQAMGARRSAKTYNGERRQSSLIVVLTHPLTLCGLALDALGWGMSRFALHTLPVFAVQTMLAGSLAVTVLAARVAFGSRLRRETQAAIVLAMVGLVLVGISAEGETTKAPGGALVLALGLGIPAMVVVAWVWTRRSPVAAGALAGAAFGASALCARAIGEIDGVVDLLASPLVWMMLVYAALGVERFTRALEHGSVSAVTAAMWVAEIVPAAAVGAVWLGDHPRPGWWPVAIGGMALTILATLRLARDEEETLPIPAGDAA